MISQATIDELVLLRSQSRMAAETFSEAIAAQADAHTLPKAALRKYVSALEAAKLEKLDDEMEALKALIEGGG
jgi:hypothetical protein